MSARFDAPLIAGSVVFGDQGLGVLGSVIRANTGLGPHGPGLLYNDWDPGDDAKEFCALIVTPPASGTLFVNEDGSLRFGGAADGTYTLVYRLLVDGADLGTAPPATFNVGTVSAAVVGVMAVREDEPDLFQAAGQLTPVVAPVVGDLWVEELGLDSLAASGYLQPAQEAEWPYLGPEPVTLSEAKLAARLDPGESQLDGQLQLLITAAREEAEHITRRRYRACIQRFELLDWPTATEVFPVLEAWDCVIRTWSAGAWSVVDPALYAFGPAGTRGSGTGVVAIDGHWPPLASRPIGPRVRIDFKAGPVVSGPVPTAQVPTVPASVKLFILAHTSAWLRNPEALSSGSLKANPLFERLLDAERLYA